MKQIKDKNWDVIMYKYEEIVSQTKRGQYLLKEVHFCICSNQVQGSLE